MNKIPFQNNTVIPPEWLNAIQNLSYEKEPGEAGYIPNPDDVFHFQQWKTFFTEYDEEYDVCRTSWVGWEKNVILRSPYTKNIRWEATISRNALVVVIPDFPENSDYIVISKSPGWSIQIPKGNIGVLFFNENGNLTKFFPLPCSSSFTNAEFNALTVLSSITLPALSILSEYIATGAVTSDKIGPAAVTSIKIDSNAITAIHIENNAVETSKIKDKAVDSFKLADQLSFVKTPKFPRKIYRTEVVTQSITIDDIDPNYDGTRFSTDGDYTIAQMMRFTDADSRFGVGDTYRIYNDTPNIISVYDYVTAPPYEIYTKIQAWTFKDFYYNGLSWELA